MPALIDECEPQVEQYLANHIAAVRDANHPVIWVCDPMHGKCVCTCYVNMHILSNNDPAPKLQPLPVIKHDISQTSYLNLQLASASILNAVHD